MKLSKNKEFLRDCIEEVLDIKEIELKYFFLNNLATEDNMDFNMKRVFEESKKTIFLYFIVDNLLKRNFILKSSLEELYHLNDNNTNIYKLYLNKEYDKIVDILDEYFKK